MATHVEWPHEEISLLARLALFRHFIVPTVERPDAPAAPTAPPHSVIDRPHEVKRVLSLIGGVPRQREKHECYVVLREEPLEPSSEWKKRKVAATPRLVSPKPEGKDHPVNIVTLRLSLGAMEKERGDAVPMAVTLPKELDERWERVESFDRLGSDYRCGASPAVERPDVVFRPCCLACGARCIVRLVERRETRRVLD